MTTAKTKLIIIEKGKEGFVIPAEFLRKLELIPGSEVLVSVDEEAGTITLKATSDGDFTEHFKDSVDSMA